MGGKEATFQEWKTAKTGADANMGIKQETSQTKIYKDKKGVKSKTPNEVLEYFLVDTENLTI